jgi:hypothetical protein
MAEPAGKNFYRPDELARALDENKSLVYRLIRLGLIKHIHLRKKIKIPRAEYERVLKEGIKEL